jgi:hypothetical protein
VSMPDTTALNGLSLANSILQSICAGMLMEFRCIVNVL